MRRTNILTFLAFLLLSACGYFENDGIKSQKRIAGNIYLQEYKNMDEVCLAHDGGNGGYTIIAGCHSAYYDSIEKRIYVESLITESSSAYYSFILKDPSSPKVWEALEKHEVLEATFKKRIAKKSSVSIKLR